MSWSWDLFAPISGFDPHSFLVYFCTLILWVFFLYPVSYCSLVLSGFLVFPALVTLGKYLPVHVSHSLVSSLVPSVRILMRLLFSYGVIFLEVCFPTGVLQPITDVLRNWPLEFLGSQAGPQWTQVSSSFISLFLCDIQMSFSVCSMRGQSLKHCLKDFSYSSTKEVSYGIGLDILLNSS